MYHKVTALTPNRIAVTPESFREQQEYLARNYRIVSLDEVRRWVRGETALPPRAVLLTFDDGYRDNLEVAYPILKRFGHTATIFVPTDFVGSSTPLPHDLALLPTRNPTLSWEQLRGLRGVFEVGSHACSHRPLTRIPLDEARREIFDSKRKLEDQIECPVYAFSYPKGSIGDFSPVLEDILRDAGYELGFTTIAAINRVGINPLRIARHNVEDYGISYFSALLDGSAELLGLKDSRLGYHAKSTINRLRRRAV
jgi:peptidoglycan/xylan/chitin deacetylase (PgdA/CDA1 family)